MEIPQIDLSAKATNEDDFTGKGVKGGSATGSEGSEGTKDGAGAGVDGDRAYAEFEVERQVSALSGTNIPYPEAMRTSGAEGEVLAEFVVNENGRVETSTFKVLNSTGAAFTNCREECSAEDAFPSCADWKYERVAGCSAGVRVQAQSITFFVLIRLPVLWGPDFFFPAKCKVREPQMTQMNDRMSQMTAEKN